MTRASDRVLVAAPGSVPELPQMASGLARAHMLDTYVTSVTASVGGPLGAVARMPGGIGRRARSVLERRPDPAGVPDGGVTHRASALDVAVVLSQRFPYPRGDRALFRFLLQLRNERFDHAVTAMLSQRHDAVVGCLGAGVATFDRAKAIGIRSFLQYPIAHHRYTKRLLLEEASLQPEFSSTLQFHDLPARLERRFDREIGTVDRIFALCAFHRQTFASEGVPESKLVTTPLGVDTDLFTPLERPDDGIFRVLFVGQIGQRKGLSYLLDGFEQAGLPDSELAVAGTPIGTTAPWIRRDRVKHFPPRPRATLPSLYASADVFVLPSLIEGFGLTPLEAMSCGRPVVISEHTFGGDLVEEGKSGYVVPIRDSTAIAERLRQLHDNPALRERMGAAARARAMRFSWGQYGRRVAEVIRGAT